ncbi:MtnX-like HAD-IB family phosphatase [Chloroflexota bacterium]
MITPPTKKMKTVFQCDFDGTITEEDVSFLLLDAFADGNWRQLLEEYKEGKIPVGPFNTRVFAMIKDDEQTLLDFIFKSGQVKIRPGFGELLSYCSQKGVEFVIVSNGLIFYIEAILRDIGIKGIKVFAAQNRFGPEGMEVKYLGPDGNQVEDSFKEAYTRLFLSRGNQIVYAGNGVSDIYPARRAHHVFATGDLLERCQTTNLNCTPFDDLNDIVRGLEPLPLG